MPHQRKTFVSKPQRVALFVTCMVDALYPEVGMATVDLLEQEGVEVVFPLDQTCCGQPAFNAGFREEARLMARHFLDVFEPLVSSGRIDAIVAPSGSCVAMVTHFYEVLFDAAEDAPEQARAATVAAVTYELTEFLVDVLGVTTTHAAFSGRLAYHACCHTLRELGVDRQPRQLLRAVEGQTPVELTGSDECCGFGGLFAIKNAEISAAMGQRKAMHIADSGADVVTLCDVSCMTHINGLLSRQGQHCRAVHIAQILTGESVPGTGAAAGSDAMPVADSPVQQQATASPPRRWQDVK